MLDAIRLQENAGADIISDGEQRRDNFYSFISEHIKGICLMTLSELLDYVENKSAFEHLFNPLDVRAFSIKNRVVNGKLKVKHPLVLNDYLFLKYHTNKPIKVTLLGPYLLHVLCSHLMT